MTFIKDLFFKKHYNMITLVGGGVFAAGLSSLNNVFPNISKFHIVGGIVLYFFGILFSSKEEKGNDCDN
jgi:hypothetical protein